MQSLQWKFWFALGLGGATLPVCTADIIVSAQDGKLVDTGERIKLAVGPVSIRSMPR